MKNAKTEARLRRLLAELSAYPVGLFGHHHPKSAAACSQCGSAPAESATNRGGEESSVPGKRSAIEKRFNVRFPDDQLSEFRTLGRLVEAIDVTLVEEKPQ